MAATWRILIAGSGSIGSVFGAFLRNAGHDVTLLGRAWHLDAISKGGLRVDGIWGEHQARGFTLAVDPTHLAGPYDLVIVSVKSYDTAGMVPLVKQHMARNGLTLSLQNGLGNVETLAVAFGGERSLGASVLVGAKTPAPGNVTVTVQAAPIVLGPLEGGSAEAMGHAEGLAALIRDSGISCEATDQILAHLWAKVFYNGALNAVGALLNLHYGALGDDPSLREIMDGVIEEAFAVATAEGVKLPWPTADAYRDLFYGSLVPSTYVHRSSMLQDLERGRRTEIDAINGEVWRRGVRLGIPTPFNQMLTLLIRGRSSEQR